MIRWRAATCCSSPLRRREQRDDRQPRRRVNQLIETSHAQGVPAACGAPVLCCRAWCSMSLRTYRFTSGPVITSTAAPAAQLLCCPSERSLPSGSCVQW
jgi:hypothetical protein